MKAWPINMFCHVEYTKVNQVAHYDSSLSHGLRTSLSGLCTTPGIQGVIICNAILKRGKKKKKKKRTYECRLKAYFEEKYFMI
jgi:hypothetical protein